MIDAYRMPRRISPALCRFPCIGIGFAKGWDTANAVFRHLMPVFRNTRPAVEGLCRVWLPLRSVCYDKRHRVAAFVYPKWATPYSRLGAKGITNFVTMVTTMKSPIPEACATGSSGAAGEFRWCRQPVGGAAGTNFATCRDLRCCRCRDRFSGAAGAGRVALRAGFVVSAVPIRQRPANCS